MGQAVVRELGGTFVVDSGSGSDTCILQLQNCTVCSDSLDTLQRDLGLDPGALQLTIHRATLVVHRQELTLKPHSALTLFPVLLPTVVLIVGCVLVLALALVTLLSLTEHIPENHPAFRVEGGLGWTLSLIHRWLWTLT